MRGIVAIANHGTAKRRCVEQLIASYRSFPFATDIVVLADEDRDYGSDVEVLVGAPTSNPYSLPFRHRSLFAERRSEYDIFVYSEDDTLVDAHNIQTWLTVQDRLPDDLVCGFVRYEDTGGRRSYSSFHTIYHWQTETLADYGGELVCGYSNLHSAAYVLGRTHLDRALASGNYDVSPHQGRYDMLVMAGAGPFLDCGLTRVLPLHRLDDLALRHLTDRYVGVHGIDEETLSRHVWALERVHDGDLRSGQLFPVQSKVDHFAYDKTLTEPALAGVLEAIPPGTRVLDVGSGPGPLVDALSRSHDLVAIPVDAVCQVELEARGVQTTSPDIDAALGELCGEAFGAVVVSNVLQHVRSPVELLTSLSTVLQAGGVIVASTPDHQRTRIRAWLQRLARGMRVRSHSFRALRPLPFGGYEQNGVHATSGRWLRRTLEDAGCVDVTIEREQQVRPQLADHRSTSRFARFFPSHVVGHGVRP